MEQRLWLNRRAFLRASLLAGAGVLLAACQPAAAPPGVTPVTGQPKPTEAPKPAAETKPAQPTPTPAPAQPVVTPTPTPVPVREAAKGRKYVIEVQYPYGGVGVQRMAEFFDAFEAANPDIGVKGVWAANDLATNQKLFTAVAAGTPPNVTWVDGPQVAEWAARGVLSDLTEFFKRDNLTQDDFWLPSWRQNIWRGKIYAITFSSDANFGFFWNKSVFSDAGLDPEKPPQTIDEMDEFHAKITRVEGNNIVRMGIIPWTVYGSANSIFTWGWVFGGEFYDPDQEKITGNHPLVVKALEWMVEKYAKKYDITRIAGFQAGFGTGENHPFFVGKTSMAPFGPWEIGNIRRYAPNLKYGITFIPAGPPPAQPRQSWVGGWCIGIPQGAKMVDQAWQFLRWAGGTPEGALTLGKTFSNFSGYKKNPWLEIAAKDKDLASFIEILKEAKHQRPVMPAQAFYMGALQRAVDDALYGRMTPKAALDKATEDTQRELDKILKKA